MTVGQKLGFLVLAALLAAQLVTAAVIHHIVRLQIEADGRSTLIASAGRLARQVGTRGDQIAADLTAVRDDASLAPMGRQPDGAALFAAFARRDPHSLVTRLLLLHPAGDIAFDTMQGLPSGTRRIDPAVLQAASKSGAAQSIASLSGGPHWMIVVPAGTHDPADFLAAAIPLDARLLARLSEEASTVRTLVLVDAAGHWTTLAGDRGKLPPSDAPPGDAAAVVAGGGTGLLALSAQVIPPASSAAAAGQPHAAVAMTYDVTARLGRYHLERVLLIDGLVVGLTAAVMIALLVSSMIGRPLAGLVTQTRRISRGDLTPPPTLRRRDEIGALSAALGAMLRAFTRRETQVREEALRDPVTGLRNRAAFLEAIQPGMTNGSAAILVIGLVRLQEIANTLGHGIADRVLRHTALRLGRLLADADIACLGGRTFAAFLPGVDEPVARALAATIVSHFESPYSNGDLAIDTVAAVGIALLPLHGEQAEPLLRRAEVAFQGALKSEPRWALYDPATDPHTPERLSLMSELRQGFGSGEFVLAYQPKLHLPTRRILAVEALVRWHHPRHGLVPPDLFVPLAEETGNIRHLTRWALRTGIGQAAAWRAEGIDVQVAINLSARDLSDSALPSAVASLLEEAGVGTSAISLEVTESAIMADPAAAIAVLREFSERGIDAAIDDFGVGQTSLAYLRSLPIREIKIDKTFVQRIVEDEDDRKIVRSVVELGHSLGRKVSVEGVEDAATLSILASLGCDHAQGYYIARPLVADALAAFVRQPPKLVSAAGMPA